MRAINTHTQERHAQVETVTTDVCEARREDLPKTDRRKGGASRSGGRKYHRLERRPTANYTRGERRAASISDSAAFEMQVFRIATRTTDIAGLSRTRLGLLPQVSIQHRGMPKFACRLALYVI